MPHIRRREPIAPHTKTLGRDLSEQAPGLRIERTFRFPLSEVRRRTLDILIEPTADFETYCAHRREAVEQCLTSVDSIRL